MDKYNLREAIGSGAFGTVYRGTRKSDGLEVAVKVLNNVKYSWEQVLLLREVDALQHCYHRNVVPLIEVVLGFDGVLHLVFEFFPYDQLKFIKDPELLERDSLNVHDQQSIMSQIVSGVAYLHEQGYMHRDLKPENVLVKRIKETDKLHVVLADLGITRRFSGQEQTVVPEDAQNSFQSDFTEYIATRWYRSPELLLMRPYGPSIDLWAVGCIFIELVLGNGLFMGSNSEDTLRKIASILGYPTSLYPSLSLKLGVQVRTDQRLVFRKFFAQDKGGEDEILESGFQFLQKCLDWDPFTRITAQEACSYTPFIVHEGNLSPTPAIPPIMTNQLQNIQSHIPSKLHANNGLFPFIQDVFDDPQRRVPTRMTYQYHEDLEDLKEELLSSNLLMSNNENERQDSWMIFSSIKNRVRAEVSPVTIEEEAEDNISLQPVVSSTSALEQQQQRVRRLATGKRSEYVRVPGDSVGTGFSRSIPQQFSTQQHVTLPCGKCMIESEILSLLQVRLAFYWTVDVAQRALGTVTDRSTLQGTVKLACLVMKDGILSTCRTTIDQPRDQLDVLVKMVQYNVQQQLVHRVVIDCDIQAMLESSNAPDFILEYKRGNFNYNITTISYHDDDVLVGSSINQHHVRQFTGTRPNTATIAADGIANKRVVSHEEAIIVETFSGNTQVKVESVRWDDEQNFQDKRGMHANTGLNFVLEPVHQEKQSVLPQDLSEESEEEVRRWGVYDDISSDEFGI